jgi:hypothetical protein
MVVNAIGGVTLAIIVGVIALLLIQLPELVNFLGRGSPP